MFLYAKLRVNYNLLHNYTCLIHNNQHIDEIINIKLYKFINLLFHLFLNIFADFESLYIYL